MGQPRKLGIYFLFLVFLALIVIVTIPLFGSRIGNTFSTIANCLPGSDPCVTKPAISATDFTEPTLSDSSDPIEEQLEKIDQVLNQSIQSSIAYNVPDEVRLEDTVTVELLLNPSASPTELASQINENGEVVTAVIQITPMMKAELIPQNAEALTVQPIHADAVQLIGSLDTTRWAWLVTGKKGGAQKLILVIYRLIKFEGEEYWREVDSYQAEINVQVTFGQQVQSLGWILASGVLLAVSLIAVLWRGFGRRGKRRERMLPSMRSGKAGHLFISYRRSDSADITGRIYDRLVDEFGRDTIFKDVDSIPLGTNFKEYLDRKVSECNVLLAIIGDGWTESSDASGKRRLDDPQDFVRLEIESALERGIPVIPLLVRGAPMPSEKDLPASLRKLVYQNGIPIRPDPDFHRDMDRLISALDEMIATAPRRRVG
jgi:hypothetical protein